MPLVAVEEDVSHPSNTLDGCEAQTGINAKEEGARSAKEEGARPQRVVCLARQKKARWRGCSTSHVKA
eukprot:6188202-Pleurochrysis_carterae.AAC.3